MRKVIVSMFAGIIFLTPLIICPVTIDYYNTPKEFFTQLSVILCLVLWLRMCVKKETLDIIYTNFYMGLIALGIIAGVSLSWARNPYLGLKDFVQLLTYAGAFFICINTVKQSEAKKIAAYAFLSGLVAAVYAIFQYRGLDFITYPGVHFADWRFKLYTTFGNPDFLSNYLITVLPLGIALYITGKTKLRKAFYFLGICIAYTSLLLLFSLGAIISFGLSMLAISIVFFHDYFKVENFMCTRDRLKNIMTSIIVLAAALSLITAFLFIDNKVHAKSIPNQAKASFAWRHGMDNRIILYKSAYHIIRDHPIRGVGIGNFKLRYPEYRAQVLQARHETMDSALLDKERDKNVLNDLLQVWVELGVIGFLVFIALILKISKNAIVSYREAIDYKRRIFVLGLNGGILAFLLHSCISFPMHVVPNALLFWTLVGLLFTQLPRAEEVAMALDIRRPQKRLFGILILLAAIAAAVWPVRMYLSEVFLKRMVEFDKKGAPSKALVEAHTAQFFNPNSPAITYIGNTDILRNDHKSAIDSLRKILKQDDSINYHVALAEIYFKEGLTTDCINEYTKAISLNPFSIPLRLRMADIYMALKRYDEVEAQCQFLLLNYPSNEALKQKINDMLRQIFEEKFFTLYGKVPAKK